MKASCFFLSCIFLFGCIEQIELDTEPIGDQLVIFGGINTSDLEQTIEIFKTSPFQNRFSPILGATVKVIDNLGNEGQMFGNTRGIYTLNLNSIDIIPGRAYYLDITLVSGDHYRSEPQLVPFATAIETSTREYKVRETLSEGGVVVEDQVLEFTGTTEIFNELSNDFYLRWDIDEVYVLRPTDFPDPFNDVPDEYYFSLEVDPQNIALFNGEGIRITSLDRKVLATKPFDYTFLDKHFFFIQVHSMTRETYNFWRKLDLLTNSTGSIFDVPPGAIASNLFNVNDPEEEVLGFFEVTNMTYERIVVFRDDGPFEPPPSGCDYDPSILPNSYPRYCLRCLSEEGCSFERPPYFDG